MKNSKKIDSVIIKSFENKAIKIDKIKGGNQGSIIVVIDDTQY